MQVRSPNPSCKDFKIQWQHLGQYRTLKKWVKRDLRAYFMRGLKEPLKVGCTGTTRIRALLHPQIQETLKETLKWSGVFSILLLKGPCISNRHVNPYTDGGRSVSRDSGWRFCCAHHITVVTRISCNIIYYKILVVDQLLDIGFLLIMQHLYYHKCYFNTLTIAFQYC